MKKEKPPKVNNLVAKHSINMNKAKTHADVKNDYTRKIKHKKDVKTGENDE
jgi:hypothetical protein